MMIVPVYNHIELNRRSSSAGRLLYSMRVGISFYGEQLIYADFFQ